MSSRYLPDIMKKGENYTKMGKNLEKLYSFRCDDETIKKLEFIAKKNTRNRNQEIKHVIKEHIERFENKYEEIKIED